MTTRNEFINSISTILGRDSIPEQPSLLSYQHDVHNEVMQNFSPDELTGAFIENSTAIGATVIETTAKECADAIKNILPKNKEAAVVLEDDPLIRELELNKALAADRTVKKWDANETREENISFAERATVGIAVAELALAETGTVMLYCHSGSGRSVSLLPESTIYLIRKSSIRPRLTQAMAHLAELSKPLPTSVNLVTGPSATADIELVRVVGVHGPVAVTYVVIEDL